MFARPLLLVRLGPALSAQLSTKPKIAAKNEFQKVIRVAVIGVPNAGKSTLINELVEQRVCPVSRKVHTTRNFSQAIAVRGSTQVVFFDTPGIITEREKKKHHLESSFISAYRHSIQHADLIAVVHDVSNSYTREELHPSVMSVLEEYHKLPSFLVMNKIDALRSKRVLLDLTKTLTNGCLAGVPFEMSRFGVKKTRKSQTEEHVEPPKGWPNFSEIFMTSALKQDGTSEIMEWLTKQGKPSPWLFEAHQYTDMKPEDLVVKSVHAKLLDFLPQEIPYQLELDLEFYSFENQEMFASVLIKCNSERIERLICGEKCGRLRQITEHCTSDLIETFHVPVSLTLSTMAKSAKK